MTPGLGEGTVTSRRMFPFGQGGGSWAATLPSRDLRRRVEKRREGAMRIGEICSRDVVFAHQEETALEVARLMERFHVGDVVVVAEEDGRRFPVGIVTDRDLTIKVMARGLAPERTSVQDIACGDLLTLGEDEGLYEAIERMRNRGVRRAPVVDLEGELVGIISVDDVLGVLAEELTGLVRLVSKGQLPGAVAP